MSAVRVKRSTKMYTQKPKIKIIYSYNIVFLAVPPYIDR